MWEVFPNLEIGEILMMSRKSGFLLLASMSCYFIEIGKRDVLDLIHIMLMASG